MQIFPDAHWLVNLILMLGAIAGALLSVIGLLVRLGIPQHLANEARESIQRIVDEALAPIVAEIQPNSGKSMNDRLRRIEVAVIDLGDESRAGRNALRADLDSHIEESDGRHDSIVHSLARIEQRQH